MKRNYEEALFASTVVAWNWWMDPRAPSLCTQETCFRVGNMPLIPLSDLTEAQPASHILVAITTLQRRSSTIGDSVTIRSSRPRRRQLRGLLPHVVLRSMPPVGGPGLIVGLVDSNFLRMHNLSLSAHACKILE